VLVGALLDFFGGAFGFDFLDNGVGSSSTSSLSFSNGGSLDLVGFRTTVGESESGSGSGNERGILREK